MNARIWLVTAGAAGAAAAFAGTVRGQDLARRIDGAADGPVGISFAARADVCGSGFGYLRVGSGGFGDGFGYSWSDGAIGNGCEAGPVRVLLNRAERRVTGVRVGAGTVKWPAGTTDLGLVPAGAAARYFLTLAGGIDGRVGREALTAAVLADSAEAGPALVALARNRSLSRGLRESAASWLGRECATAAGPAARELAGALTAIAADEDEPSGVRSRAVTALGRSDGSDALLIGLARSDEPAVARAAVAALGRSGSRPAREALVRAVRDSGTARSVRAEAVRALGGRDATPADLAALRGLWPTLAGDDLKGAVLQTTAETGGNENARWLLSVARDGGESPGVRARAVQAAEQAGTGSAELIRLYDEAGDRRVREAVMEALVRIGDQTARKKIGAIAQSDTDPQLRRLAVNRLARDGDRRAVEWLEGVVK